MPLGSKANYPDKQSGGGKRAGGSRAKTSDALQHAS
ncbi:UNVERIFIED_ORG: hypothetical protein OKW25_001872 [Pseudomonas vranovensis]|nr:hypothetical protein [Pseudomonas vranovensis]